MQYCRDTAPAIREECYDKTQTEVNQWRGASWTVSRGDFDTGQCSFAGTVKVMLAH
jgi:hypothetical protein